MSNPTYDPAAAHSPVWARSVTSTGAAAPSGATADPVYTQPPYSRPGTATVNFTPGGTYPTMGVIGGPTGYLAVTLGLVSTAVKFMGAALFVPMNSATTLAGVYFLPYTAQPTETYTDGAALNITATDTNKIKRCLPFDNRLGAASAKVIGYSTNVLPQPIDMVTDAAGKLYFVLVSGTAGAWDTPGSSRFTVDYLY